MRMVWISPLASTLLDEVAYLGMEVSSTARTVTLSNQHTPGG